MTPDRRQSLHADRNVAATIVPGGKRLGPSSPVFNTHGDADARRMLHTLSMSFDVAGASIVEYVRGPGTPLAILDDLRTCFSV